MNESRVLIFEECSLTKRNIVGKMRQLFRK